MRERLMSMSLELWNPTRLIRTTSRWRPVPRGVCRAGRRVYQQVTSPACGRKFQFQFRLHHRVLFACVNVWSLNNKLEDVLEIVRDRRIDICCVTESWHDADSACLGLLRSAGFNVVNRPRPRVADDLSVNHGGVVVLGG